MKDEMNEIGSNIKKLRKKAHLTQEQLAEKIGVERVTIVRYETGIFKPSNKYLMMLANVFGCTTDYLNGISGPDNESSIINARNLTMVPIYGTIHAVETSEKCLCSLQN